MQLIVPSLVFFSGPVFFTLFFARAKKSMDCELFVVLGFMIAIVILGMHHAERIQKIKADSAAVRETPVECKQWGMYSMKAMQEFGNVYCAPSDRPGKIVAVTALFNTKEWAHEMYMFEDKVDVGCVGDCVGAIGTRDRMYPIKEKEEL